MYPKGYRGFESLSLRQPSRGRVFTVVYEARRIFYRNSTVLRHNSAGIHPNMANRRVRVVRSVKINGRWKYLTPSKAATMRIPNNQGRWYISWRAGPKKEWERCDSELHRSEEHTSELQSLRHL